MADSSYESVLCVKNEVFVYKIPPRPSNRGYRAAEWKLDVPDWTGRLRVVSLNKDLFIKLENKDGELFAQCPVECYPSVAVESVMDSSRYFVLRIKDESGRSAFIGIGFADRSDSFDLNVTLQDHFKWLKQEQEAEKATKELQLGPSLDLGFKAGQTITLNLGTKKDGAAKSRPKPRALGGGGGMMGGFLPPPPGGSSSGGGGGVGGGAIRMPPPAMAPPPSQQPSASSLSDSADEDEDFGSAFPSNPPPPSSNTTTTTAAAATTATPNSASGGGSSDVDLLMGLDSNDWVSSASSAEPLAPTSTQDPSSGGDLWGDFASAPSANSNTQADAFSNSGGDWIQF